MGSKPKKPGPDGKPHWRVVLDFHPLNAKTIGMAFPIPNITNIFNQLGNDRIFTVVDCVSGFHQMEIHEEDRHKTAFSTSDGHNEYIRMAFGLKNARPYYMKAILFTLRDLIGKGVLIFIDDIIFYAKDMEEHCRLFNEVISKVQKYSCNRKNAS